jgi:hypothetical protein
MVETHKPAILVYSGTFCPLTAKHKDVARFAKHNLETQHGYRVEKIYFVALPESVLRKKFNGSVPLENEDRAETIKAELPGQEELPFLDLLENDESPGWATKELMKAHADHTIISLLPIHKLNSAVAMA